MIEQAQLVERFFRYVRCGSESRVERAFCEMVESELAAMGLAVVRDDVGAACGSDGFNVHAFLPGEGEPLLFCAHLDTVPPGNGVEPVLLDGVIHSRGDTVLGADDKSGVAAVMEALSVLTSEGLAHRPVEVLFTICEEIGLLGAKHADYSNIRSREAVVLDSSNLGWIINRAPAVIRMHVEISGRSAHAAAAPETGVHALKAAARAIDRIPCGRVGDESVMNVSNLLSPGKTNIVPDSAVFDMEIRSFSEETLSSLRADAEREIAGACETYGATFVIDTARQSDAQYMPPDTPLVQSLVRAFAQVGTRAETVGTLCGCDATWLNHNGICAVNIGTGKQDIHSLDEHIAVSDLLATANVVLALMRSVK